MTRKEKIDLILSKVPEDKKEEFIAELRKAKTAEERAEVLKKFGAKFTKEEAEAFNAKDASNEISDEELDKAAGGCCSCSMPCPGSCTQFCTCY